MFFGTVSWTKNVDINKFKYSGYKIGFDKKETFSFGNGFGRNCIMFGVDMSSFRVDYNDTAVDDYSQIINIRRSQPFNEKNWII